MDEVRLGLIGCGGMGRGHLNTIKDMPRAKLTAASDSFEQNLSTVVEQYEVKGFEKADDLLDSGLVDAVIIATPHYFHPTYSIAALERGIHVLTEKPVSVTAKAAEEVNNTAAKHPELKYAAMFQMRTNPMWKRIHDIVTSGELGELQRMQWTATNWFRSQAYYNSGGWRATWEGEGGGVLLNQCPHNLDLVYWLTGQPSRIRASVSLGKYHDIEVEDDVTAFFEYPNGATGTFIASTGEGPGTSFFELVGDRGKITVPGNGANFTHVHVDGSVNEYFRNTDKMWGFLPTTSMEVKTPDGGGHRVIHENFVAAILDGDDLIAPAAEGVYSVEVANAMIMSGITDTTIDLPMDRDGYDAFLKGLIEKSKAGATA